MTVDTYWGPMTETELDEYVAKGLITFDDMGYPVSHPHAS